MVRDNFSAKKIWLELLSGVADDVCTRGRRRPHDFVFLSYTRLH